MRPILLRDACVVTMDPALGELSRGAVLIEGNRIAADAPDIEAGDGKARPTVAASTRVLFLRVIRAAPRHLVASPPGNWRIASIYPTIYARFGAGHRMAGVMEPCAQIADTRVDPRGFL